MTSVGNEILAAWVLVASGVAGRLDSGAATRRRIEANRLACWYRAMSAAWYVLVCANRLQNQALARFSGDEGEHEAELKVEKGSEAA